MNEIDIEFEPFVGQLKKRDILKKVYTGKCIASGTKTSIVLHNTRNPGGKPKRNGRATAGEHKRQGPWRKIGTSAPKEVQNDLKNQPKNLFCGLEFLIVEVEVDL